MLAGKRNGSHPRSAARPTFVQAPQSPEFSGNGIGRLVNVRRTSAIKLIGVGERSFLKSILLRLALVTLASVALPATATASALEVVTAARRIAIVSAIEPEVRFQKVGVTAFQNMTWATADTGFEINSAALDAARKFLKREAKLIDGRSVGLLSSVGRLIDEKQLAPRLLELAAEWEVEAILIIQGFKGRDWIGSTNQSVDSVGIYSRPPRQEAYCALRLLTFDCVQRRFESSETATVSQAMPRTEWRASWASFPDTEKRLVLHGLRTVVEDGVPSLLAKAGLAESRTKEKSLAGTLFGVRRGRSWVPDGNELEIPAGLSNAAARLAVATALVERGWTISSKDADKIVGVLPRGKIEAVATATVGERTITLVSERFETRSDGSRAKIDPNLSWHRNLMDSILRALLKTAPDK
jgi:hypothetical protein